MPTGDQRTISALGIVLKYVTTVLRPHTEIIALDGGDYLESVHWRNNEMGQPEEHKIRHVFVMAGAAPNTRWLDGCVTLDAKGFIKTGPVLSPEDLSAARWPLARPPYLLETSLPGVFAVGDVGSSKDSAVGDKVLAIGSPQGLKDDRWRHCKRSSR